MKFSKALLIGISEESLDQSSWAKIDKLITKKVFAQKDSAEFEKQLPEVDCILVGFGISITKEDLQAAKKLKYIGVQATAFGKIDTNFARKNKVVVTNLGGYSTEAVAELTIAAILERTRKLEESKLLSKNGNYTDTGIESYEIRGKNFGVLGLGKIGMRVAQLALGFNADVMYWSRTKKKNAKANNISYQNADSLIKSADFISINLAQTKETENFLNAERIKMLKSGVLIVNTAPMELIDTDALAKRLAKGDITFVLDHSDEMNKEDLKKLSKYKNCVIYPPIGLTKEAKENRKRIFLENIEGFLKGKPSNVVN
jgi:phosphoglycerate dehydrogenase-like enzyme